MSVNPASDPVTEEVAFEFGGEHFLAIFEVEEDSGECRKCHAQVRDLWYKLAQILYEVNRETVIDLPTGTHTEWYYIREAAYEAATKQNPEWETKPGKTDECASFGDCLNRQFHPRRAAQVAKTYGDEPPSVDGMVRSTFDPNLEKSVLGF